MPHHAWRWTSPSRRTTSRLFELHGLRTQSAVGHLAASRQKHVHLTEKGCSRRVSPHSTRPDHVPRQAGRTDDAHRRTRRRVRAPGADPSPRRRRRSRVRPVHARSTGSRAETRATIGAIAAVRAVAVPPRPSPPPRTSSPAPSAALGSRQTPAAEARQAPPPEQDRGPTQRDDRPLHLPAGRRIPLRRDIRGALLRAQRDNARLGDTVIDVGGNINLFAMYAAKRCVCGKVFTLEPIPSVYRAMVRNLCENLSPSEPTARANPRRSRNRAPQPPWRSATAGTTPWTTRTSATSSADSCRRATTQTRTRGGIQTPPEPASDSPDRRRRLRLPGERHRRVPIERRGDELREPGRGGVGVQLRRRRRGLFFIFVYFYFRMIWALGQVYVLSESRGVVDDGTGRS